VVLVSFAFNFESQSGIDRRARRLYHPFRDACGRRYLIVNDKIMERIRIPEKIRKRMFSVRRRRASRFGFTGLEPFF
jgi:hypothetical protein